MSKQVVIVGVLLVGTDVVSAGNLPLPYHRKAKVRCGLSNCYDYEVRKSSPSAVGTTFNTLALPLFPAVAPPMPAAPTPIPSLAGTPTPLPGVVITNGGEAVSRVRYWQAVDRELRVDHCAISQVAVWIDENGGWSVNLKADQHPFIGPDKQATPEARYLRNRFRVTVRAYAASPLTEDPATSSVGKPEMFHLDLPAFWVDRDQTLRHSATGVLKDTNELRRVPLVDRMTVEFRYE